MKWPLPKVKNKKAIALMKDDFVGKVMTEFVWLGPKTYSYLLDDVIGDRKAKVTKKCVLNRRIDFEDYKKYL